MTYGNNNKITWETNKTIRINALRICTSGLSGSISETLFSLNPPDLSNVLIIIEADILILVIKTIIIQTIMYKPNQGANSSSRKGTGRFS